MVSERSEGSEKVFGKVEETCDVYSVGLSVRFEKGPRRIRKD